MKIIVGHGTHFCDTGCCGHVIEVEMTADEQKQFPHLRSRSLVFDHPFGEDKRKFAEDLVRQKFGPEHVKDLDWDECYVLDD